MLGATDCWRGGRRLWAEVVDGEGNSDLWQAGEVRVGRVGSLIELWGCDWWANLESCDLELISVYASGNVLPAVVPEVSISTVLDIRNRTVVISLVVESHTVLHFENDQKRARCCSTFESAPPMRYIHLTTSSRVYFEPSQLTSGYTSNRR